MPTDNHQYTTEQAKTILDAERDTFRGMCDARDHLHHPSGVCIAYFARRDPAWDEESEAYRKAYRETWDAERWA